MNVVLKYTGRSWTHWPAPLTLTGTTWCSYHKIMKILFLSHSYSRLKVFAIGQTNVNWNHLKTPPNPLQSLDQNSWSWSSSPLPRKHEAITVACTKYLHNIILSTLAKHNQPVIMKLYSKGKTQSVFFYRQKYWKLINAQTMTRSFVLIKNSLF